MPPNQVIFDFIYHTCHSIQYLKQLPSKDCYEFRTDHKNDNQKKYRIYITITKKEFTAHTLNSMGRKRNWPPSLKLSGLLYGHNMLNLRFGYVIVK